MLVKCPPEASVVAYATRDVADGVFAQAVNGKPCEASEDDDEEECKDGLRGAERGEGDASALGQPVWAIGCLLATHVSELGLCGLKPLPLVAVWSQRHPCGTTAGRLVRVVAAIGRRRVG